MSQSKRHCLKCWMEFFDAIRQQKKTFDVRRNDRDFQVGDEVVFQRLDPSKELPDGSCEIRRISYILHGNQFGIEEGFCVLGLELPPTPFGDGFGPAAREPRNDEKKAAFASPLMLAALERNLADLRRCVAIMEKMAEARP